MKNLLVILTFLSAFMPVNTSATNWYFNNSIGSDAGAGTLISPWKTLAKLNSVFASKAPGDSFLLNRGDVFLGSIVISRSGSSGVPIIIAPYGTGADPVITGFKTVAAWTNLGGNIWESSVAASTLATCNLVLINGINTAMGRTPNTGYYTYQSFTTNTSITSTNLNSSVINYTGAQLVVRKNNWVIDRCTITSALGTRLNYTSSSSVVGTAGYGFFIQDDVRTLDAQNEWYYNPTTKKVRIFSTSTPVNVQVATIDTLIYTRQFDYITFSHIQVVGSNKDGIELGGSRDITIKNCNLDYHGKDAIWGAHNWGAASATNFLLTNSTINHTANNGLSVDNEFTNAIVTHNTFKNIGLLVGMGGDGSTNQGTYVAMSFSQSSLVQQNVLIEYNTVDSIGYSGITFYTSSIEVAHNYVTNFCLNKIDGGGIYTWFQGAAGPRSNRTNQTVHDNIVMHGHGSNAGTTNTGAPLVQCFYMDDGTANVELYNNTAYDADYSGYFIHNDSAMSVHNNTSYNNGKYQALVTSFTTVHPLRNLTFKSNILFPVLAAQKCASFESGANDISSFGTVLLVDSNYYARPIDDNLTIQTVVNGATFTQRTLATWKSFSAFDFSGNKSPLIITNTGQLFFAYNPTDHDSTVTLPAGTWKDVRVASYSGTTVLHSFASVILISSGSIITPTITWGPLTAITWGTAISSTQLSASTGVAGTYAYTIGGVPVNIGDILSANTYSIVVVFTPTDPTSYTTATKTVTLVVNPVPETISYSVLSKPFTGFPLLPDAVTSPPGLPTSTTLDGVTGGKVNANSYNAITGNIDPNHVATPISGVFTITPAPASISVGNLLHTYDSTLKAVNPSTIPAGLSTIITYSHPPLVSGPDTVIVRLNDPNYTATPDTVILVISKATPSLVSWIPATPITFGDPLGPSQQDAIFNKPGITTYTPDADVILNAGPQTLSADFAATDTNYNSLLGITTSIVVNKAGATIAVPDTVQVGDGTAKHVTPIVTPNVGVVTILYGGSPSQPTTVGDHPFTVTLTAPNHTAVMFSGTLHITSNVGSIVISNYTNRPYTGFAISPTVTTLYPYAITFNGSATVPDTTGDFIVIAHIIDGIHTGADTVTMTIIKGTMGYTWPNPASAVYGTVLGGTQLNLTSPVAGATIYSPIAGTAPNVGTFVITAVRTPTDTANWNVLTVSVTMTITKLSGSFTVSNFNQTYDSTKKTVNVSTTPAGVSGYVVTYAGDTAKKINSGTYAVNVHNTNPNYNIADFNGSLTINKGASVITWPKPGQLVFPAPITVNELDATANHAGILTYTPALGAIFSPGVQQLRVDFTPTNNNYYTATKTVSITIIGNSQGSKFFYYNGQFYFLKK